jgi:hypothetical protein
MKKSPSELAELYAHRLTAVNASLKQHQELKPVTGVLFRQVGKPTNIFTVCIVTGDALDPGVGATMKSTNDEHDYEVAFRHAFDRAIRDYVGQQRRSA